MHIRLVTSFTLVAFATNSLLCRLALGGNLIDPLSFTAFRLVSGAMALALLSCTVPEEDSPKKVNGAWASGLALFIYAIAFSLAYVSLSTGSGALLLFGSVQITMMAAALKSGEKPGGAQWFGSALAIGGLIYLVLPGLSAPNPVGALLMCVAGIAWGVYSIRGKSVSAPATMTAKNFLRSGPMAIVVSAAGRSSVHLVPTGILLALLSGGITSGLGYVLWYKALRGLTTTQAAVAQLLVPVLAAFGGVALLSERMSVRLMVSSMLILGGVALAILKRKPAPRRDSVVHLFAGLPGDRPSDG